jgi:hypothetical protein
MAIKKRTVVLIIKGNDISCYSSHIINNIMNISTIASLVYERGYGYPYDRILLDDGQLFQILWQSTEI